VAIRVHVDPKEAVLQAASDLHPSYFALVMATGSVSSGCYLLGMDSVAWALFHVNIGFFAVLWLLTLVRLRYHRPRLIADLLDHARGPGFFTLVAGTCVLGIQFVVLLGDFTTALLLWSLGVLLGFPLMYTFFLAAMVRGPKPSLDSGLNGGWLLIVVATQSVSVLSTLLAPHYPALQEPFLAFTLGAHLLGCMLYILIISIIFYRLLFFNLTPEALSPPYWINMGAMAITTLAGAVLVLASSGWPFLQQILPFLEGLTLLFWITATWWIPLLLILGAWRHLYRRFPLAYDPEYWGLVFPLGMYATSTFQLARATGLSFLLAIPHYFIYVALTAWLATFAGLIRRLMNGVLEAQVPSLLSRR
jgi:tellurite resistance protein TehA-like permease